MTKVTKGGSNMSFRATVVVGDGAGKVGVGCAKAREVQVAVTKAAADARKQMVSVPIAKGASFPHRVTVKGSGGAVVMLRPAGPGTGVIAGGSCRTVLELAGYKNCFAKQLGSLQPAQQRPRGRQGSRGDAHLQAGRRREGHDRGGTLRRVKDCFPLKPLMLVGVGNFRCERSGEGGVSVILEG